MSLRSASPAGLPAVLRVLVVERSTATARNVRRALEREPGVRVSVARGPGSATKLLEREPFDAILVEEELWDGGQSALAATLRDERPDMAVILLTADGAVPNVGTGAHEAIARPELDRDKLVERLGAAVAETRGARRRDTMVRWLERDARTDRATGLFNRASFNERLRDACKAGSRAGTPVTVVVIEVEAEVAGEDATERDAAYRRAAAGVARAIRSVDFAARSGDGVFAVLLPGAGLELGRRIARRMAQEVDRLNGEAWPDEAAVSLRFGVASGIDCDPDELYTAAEANLRLAGQPSRKPAAGHAREERDGPSVA